MDVRELERIVAEMKRKADEYDSMQMHQQAHHARNEAARHAFMLQKMKLSQRREAAPA